MSMRSGSIQSFTFFPMCLKPQRSRPRTENSRLKLKKNVLEDRTVLGGFGMIENLIFHILAEIGGRWCDLGQLDVSVVQVRH